MQRSISRTPARRGIAAAVSGVLVSGAIAGTVVGAAGPANAAEQDVTKDFTPVCQVKAGGLDLGTYNIKAHLATTAELPLVPGASSPAQDVAVTLTMPKKLQKATTSVLKVTHAKGGSPDSAVDITLPVPEAMGGTVTNRIPLQNLSAPKAKVPKKKKWKITSTGKVPELQVPGFAGNGNPAGGTNATLSLAPKFTIKATLFAKNGKKFPSTMKCKVPKADRLITDQAPIVGKYVTDTVDVHKGVGFNKSAQVQLVLFNAGANPANTWTEPEHGTLTPGAQGLFTYTADKGYAGPDSFTYTAKDDSGESTSTVTLKVKKAPSELKLRAPKKIRFGHQARVRVTVKSQGERTGPIRITKGKRVLDKAKVRDGRATLIVKRKALKVGKHQLKVRYAGSDTARQANAKLTLRVLKKR